MERGAEFNNKRVATPRLSSHGPNRSGEDIQQIQEIFSKHLAAAEVRGGADL